MAGFSIFYYYYPGGEKYSMSIKETKTDYVITAGFPGIKKEDISVEIRENLLAIFGVKKECIIKEDRCQGQRENNIYFLRTISLPENADMPAMDAEYDNNVLIVHVPKKIKDRALMFSQLSRS